MTPSQSIRINDPVRVTRDIGDAAVSVGDVGIVCSIWSEPAVAYEVELRRHGAAYGIRAVVFHEQLEAIEADRPEIAA